MYPWVVAFDKAGRNQHVHVHFFNIKAITVLPHTTVCQFQERKVLRNVDLGIVKTENTGRMAMHRIEDSNVSLSKKIKLDGNY